MKKANQKEQLMYVTVIAGAFALFQTYAELKHHMQDCADKSKRLVWVVSSVGIGVAIEVIMRILAFVHIGGSVGAG